MSGYLQVILAVLMWSYNGLLVRRIDVSGLAILSLTSFIAGFILISKVLFERRQKELWPREGRSTLLLITVGILLTFNNGLFFSSLKLTTIANATLTHYLAPVLIALLAPLLIKEKLSKIVFLALLLGFVGLIFILRPSQLNFSNANFLGIVLGTGSAVFFALEIIGKRRVSQKIAGDVIAIWQVIIVGFILLFSVPFGYLNYLDNLSRLLLLVLGLNLAVSFTLFNRGLATVRAQHAGILAYLEPAGAVVWAAIFLKEPVLSLTLVGGLFIFIAGILVIRFSRN